MLSTNLKLPYIYESLQWRKKLSGSKCQQNTEGFPTCEWCATTDTNCWSSDVRQLAWKLSFSPKEINSMENEWLDLLVEDEDTFESPQAFWEQVVCQRSHFCHVSWGCHVIASLQCIKWADVSMVKKNYTDERSQLAQSTLTSLLSAKVNTVWLLQEYKAGWCRWLIYLFF